MLTCHLCGGDPADESVKTGHWFCDYLESRPIRFVTETPHLKVHREYLSIYSTVPKQTVTQHGASESPESAKIGYNVVLKGIKSCNTFSDSDPQP